MVDVTIVNETSPEANWNWQAGRQAGRQTCVLGGCASKNYKNNIQTSQTWPSSNTIPNMNNLTLAPQLLLDIVLDFFNPFLTKLDLFILQSSSVIRKYGFYDLKPQIQLIYY